MNYNLRESINVNSILSKVEAIIGKTKITHPRAEIIELDGTKYIYYSYFDKGFDDDGLDMVWDKCSDLKGVVDVGFGYGYGLENTKYENSLLIELDDDVIVESKKSARKSIKESKYKVGDFKNTSNRQISISYVNEEDNPLWVGSPDELDDCDYLDYNVEEVEEEGKTLYLSIEESKKSARKSIKESRGQTVAELLQNASYKTKVYIYSDNTGDEFEGTVDELKGEYSRFLYYTVRVWNNLTNDKYVNIYCY